MFVSSKDTLSKRSSKKPILKINDMVCILDQVSASFSSTRGQEKKVTFLAAHLLTANGVLKVRIQAV